MREFIYKPPKKIKYEGYIYNVHTEHRNILNLLEDMNNPTITDTERSVILVTRIFGKGYKEDDHTLTKYCPVNDKTVHKALEILNNGKLPEEDNASNEAFMDFAFDYKLYRLDILRNYNKDILNGIEWWELWNMVENLPKDSLLRETIDLRTMDTKGMDAKTKRAVKKAQEQVAIPKREYIKEEVEFIDIFEDWL